VISRQFIEILDAKLTTDLNRATEHIAAGDPIAQAAVEQVLEEYRVLFPAQEFHAKWTEDGETVNITVGYMDVIEDASVEFTVDGGKNVVTVG
jgi:hypothetical protein